MIFDDLKLADILNKKHSSPFALTSCSCDFYSRGGGRAGKSHNLKEI